MELMDGVQSPPPFFMYIWLTVTLRLFYTRPINLVGHFEPQKHSIERRFRRCLGLYECLPPSALPRLYQAPGSRGSMRKTTGLAGPILSTAH